MTDHDMPEQQAYRLGFGLEVLLLGLADELASQPAASHAAAEGIYAA